MLDEFAAFKARMEASPILAGKVHRTVRKDSTGTVRANYVVAKSSAPDRMTDARLTGVDSFDSDRRYTYDVRVVAVDGDGLDVLAEAALRQLVGHRLVVPGRSCTPIELVPNVEQADGHDRTTDLLFRDFSVRFWSNRTL